MSSLSLLEETTLAVVCPARPGQPHSSITAWVRDLTMLKLDLIIALLTVRPAWATYRHRLGEEKIKWTRLCSVEPLRKDIQKNSCRSALPLWLWSLAWWRQTQRGGGRLFLWHADSSVLVDIWTSILPEVLCPLFHYCHLEPSQQNGLLSLTLCLHRFVVPYKSKPSVYVFLRRLFCLKMLPFLSNTSWYFSSRNRRMKRTVQSDLSAKIPTEGMICSCNIKQDQEAAALLTALRGCTLVQCCFGLATTSNRLSGAAFPW